VPGCSLRVPSELTRFSTFVLHYAPAVITAVAYNERCGRLGQIATWG